MQRDNWLRFAVFLVLVGAMAYFVWVRVPLALHSEEQTVSVPAPGRVGAETPAAMGASTTTAPAWTLSGTPPRDFFAEFRVDRERARGQELEVLREVMAALGPGEAAREEAGRRYLHLSKVSAMETELEHLIRVRGFDDVIVHVGEEAVQVVVRSRGLSQEQALQIGDVVQKTTAISPHNISILPRP